MSHISIRDLQKISGETIGALAGPTPIKSGDRTVGVLVPVTDRAVQEARRRIEFGLKRPELLAIIEALVDEFTIVPTAAFEPVIAECEAALRDAVPSRTGRRATRMSWRSPGALMAIYGQPAAMSRALALRLGQRQT